MNPEKMGNRPENEPNVFGTKPDQDISQAVQGMAEKPATQEDPKATERALEDTRGAIAEVADEGMDIPIDDSELKKAEVRDELGKIEDELREKFGVNVEEISTSTVAKLRLQAKMVVNPELRRLWGAYQETLQDQEDADIAAREGSGVSGGVGKPRSRKSPREYPKTTGPNRFGLK
ncbi:hypothetical protein JW899_00145 [Candidatus Uhrbacteria bacterium]|nr:hypothetical protein [Candidatus Uhrbacteria bacterium]